MANVSGVLVRCRPRLGWAAEGRLWRLPDNARKIGMSGESGAYVDD